MAWICGFGAALPSRLVSNAEISALIGKTPEWIQSVSGIQHRRWVASGETLLELAVRAAEDCLSKTAVSASEIGLILVASASAPRRFPGPAAVVAAQLGLQEIPAIDLPIASAGALFGMALANELAPRFGPTLVVASEVLSPFVVAEPIEAGVAMLFGDGAGACLIHPTSGLFKICQVQLASDGSFAEDLRLEFQGPIQMNGRAVILQASRKIPRAIQQVLDRQAIPASQVDRFLLHQANQNLLDRVADVLTLPREKFFSNIAHYGNTSSASVLIAAAESFQQQPPPSGAYVCFAAFGAGFHWGAMLCQAG
ncbi:MAG: ketoacyl-ACP synthase III [Bryobacteraceae bacterium]|nr:ketoacyl-ACP synthase III [Bryobacteraceae bacterium]MDW8379830.1 ketoacyl-ACP synthase III [Bryobacterales bacterium]